MPPAPQDPGPLLASHPVAPADVLIVVGLAFFLGLAFEDFYAQRGIDRPGGVRTFPVLALAGLALYLIDPRHVLAFVAGLLVLGAWLYGYYVHGKLTGRGTTAASGETEGEGLGLMASACNLVAYLLGPIVLLQPAWLAVAITVGAVLLLGARERLHGLARRIPLAEITTLGEFLILTGVILPILPREPVASFTDITPHAVWLAVVVVATLSYGSYLLQRLISPRRAVLWAAVLGGLYSSTATTVVFSRRARATAAGRAELHAGIVLATALMYLRIGLVVAAFNLTLARGLAPFLTGLALAGMTVAAWILRREDRQASPGEAPEPPRNPLELSAALVFAVFFIVIAIVSPLVRSMFGRAGVYMLAAIVGVADIDPFVLSLAQGSVHGMPLPVMIVAILLAASSNNLLKAAYAGWFAGWRGSRVPIVALVALAGAGLLLAAGVARSAG
jgi:uncharacterized membrane protein (DUF4010 family)